MKFGSANSFITCLVIPVSLQAYIDSSINSQVVIDSTSSANYEAWRTNVDGPGTDVRPLQALNTSRDNNYLFSGSDRI